MEHEEEMCPIRNKIQGMLITVVLDYMRRCHEETWQEQKEYVRKLK